MPNESTAMPKAWSPSNVPGGGVFPLPPKYVE
jgi:hypothetical protein